VAFSPRTNLNGGLSFIKTPETKALVYNSLTHLFPSLFKMIPPSPLIASAAKNLTLAFGSFSLTTPVG